MLDVGFSEVLLIFVIALVVLGPEKLPRLASQVGRWVGRARAMARQFREQLEEEVNLEEARRGRAQAISPPPPAYSQDQSQAQLEGQSQVTTDAPHTPEPPAEFRTDTFSHAHPTNEYGANPLTPNGAAGSTPSPSEANVAPTQLELVPVNATQPQRTPSGETYAPATPPTHTPADVAADPTTQSDNSGADHHGHA